MAGFKTNEDNTFSPMFITKIDYIIYRHLLPFASVPTHVTVEPQ